eukprot:gene4107-5138_t
MNRALSLSMIIVSLLVLNVFAEIGGKRTLVLLDDLSIKQTHSIFFKSLEEKGYKLDFQRGDSKVSLQSYGDFKYDNLVIFSPTTEISLSTGDVTSFIDSGNNVLIAGASVVSDSIRDIASECGIEVEPDKSLVFDHFNFDKSEDDHSLIVAKDYIKDSPIILEGLNKPILYRGIGHSVRENPLNFAVLTGSSTSYSGKEKTGSALKLLGTKVGLVSSLQARNNARVTFSGSLEMFSDKLFHSKIAETDKPAANKEFVENLVSWTFQERGVLRTSLVSIEKVHPNGTSSSTPLTLTVKDKIVYTAKVEEFVQGKWVPYVGSLELQLIMLDPYIRTFIKGDKNGIYTTEILLPDVYGVFTFEGSVHRPGYSVLQTIVRHPIRPYRHDSYERFIPSAFPYYAASLSMIAGVFVFSFVFLLHNDKVL